MELGPEIMKQQTAMRDYQMSRIGQHYFSLRNRVKGDNVEHYDELVKAYREMMASVGDPDIQMLAEARKALTHMARMCLVKSDGLFDVLMADAFKEETGAKVKIVPPEEDEYYVGYIVTRHGEVFFD